MQNIWAKGRNAKGGSGKEKNIPGLSLCNAGWFLRELMVSEGGGAEARSPLQDEQMAESKCRDLFYICIPCCGALDVGFRFSLLFFSSALFCHRLQTLSYRITDAHNV